MTWSHGHVMNPSKPMSRVQVCKGMKPVTLTSTLLLPLLKPWGSTLPFLITRCTQQWRYICLQGWISIYHHTTVLAILPISQAMPTATPHYFVLPTIFPISFACIWCYNPTFFISGRRKEEERAISPSYNVLGMVPSAHHFILLQ